MPRRKRRNYDFVSNVSESLLCVNCHGVVRNAVRLRFCDHSICESCLLKRRNEKADRCPCGEILEEGTEEDSMNIRLLVEDLIIHCPNRCEEKVRLADVQTHLIEDCQMTIVQCVNVGCTRKLKRMQMDTHSQLCDHRIINCEGCGKRMKYLEQRKHEIIRGCINEKLKQVVVRQSRVAEKELRKHIYDLKQDTFKTLREKRNREKEYMWKRIERNPGSFSPTLVRRNIPNSPSAPTKNYEAWMPTTDTRSSPMLLRSRERQIKSAEQQECKRCHQVYTSAHNHEESCRWHKGVCCFDHTVRFSVTTYSTKKTFPSHIYPLDTEH